MVMMTSIVAVVGSSVEIRGEKIKERLHWKKEQDTRVYAINAN